MSGLIIEKRGWGGLSCPRGKRKRGGNLLKKKRGRNKGRLTSCALNRSGKELYTS